MGLAIAVVFDLVVPFVLLVLVGAHNTRSHTSRKSEAQFWLIVMGSQIWLVLGVGVALWRDIPRYSGATVMMDAILALPLAAIPSIVNSSTIHFFYSTQEWADFGYFTVVPIFTLGLVLWGILNPVLLRRIIQHRRSRQNPSLAPAA